VTQPDPGSMWGVVRAWADAAGLLFPQDETQGARPRVPQSVCDNCPICQGAATLDQVNPEAVAELAEMARSILTGMGSALASAAEQRLSAPTSAGDDPDEGDDPDSSQSEPGDS
jgi:hypothetical protein